MSFTLDLEEEKKQVTGVNLNKEVVMASDIVGTCLEAYVHVQRMRYPKCSYDEMEDFGRGILVVELEELIQGDIPKEIMDKTNGGRYPVSFVVKGLIPKIKPGTTYHMIGKLLVDKEWGPQYDLIDFSSDVNLDSPQEFKHFLEATVGESKAKLLMDWFQNPLEVLREGDIDKLVAVKGLGETTAKQLLEKFQEESRNGLIYAKLEPYGLTKNQAKKVVSAYGGLDAALAVLEKNPYRLIEEVDGYGWKKADEVAMHMGINPCSEFRMRAYVKYLLNDAADNAGHSWSTVKFLATSCHAIAYDLNDADLLEMMKKWIDENNPKECFLHCDRETQRIGLKSLYDQEDLIASHLMRLHHSTTKIYSNEEIENAIKESEEEVGFTYTEEQRDAIYSCVNNGVSIVVGSAGCVDCDTEFFNGTEWKRIADYKEGDKVLQYLSSGKAELVTPERYIKLPEKTLYRAHTKYGLDMCLCKEHNVYYEVKGRLTHKTWGEVIKQHKAARDGFSGKFICSFDYEGKGIPLTDIEIRLMLAVIADGSFYECKGKQRCRFHVKKERKKKELRSILNEGGWEWFSTKSAAPGYEDFYVYPPRVEKEFTPFWYGCNKHQLQLICDNVLKWDGSVYGGRRRFTSTVKSTADFVQFAFTACGYRAKLVRRDRSGQEYLTNGKYYTRQSEEYDITISDRTRVSIGGCHPENPHTEIEEYQTLDGFKYCFTVPSHMWVMRRNGKIVVTGNCGKSSIMRPVTKLLKNSGDNVCQCSLSGKAASNLSEMTGTEGLTIHKLLHYNPETGTFMCNERHPLHADLVILDEISLVGIDIFLKLLEAIPSGCKLIMLGDSKQLESIGVGNLIKDIPLSGAVNSKVLIQIHRQAAKSGIITESMRISAGEKICSQYAVNERRGELKDLKVITYSELALTAPTIMDEYRNLWGSGIPVKDIMVILPMKDKGDASVLYINRRVQSMVNGYEQEEDVTVNKGGNVYTLRPGDKIIIKKNSYEAMKKVGTNEQGIDLISKEAIFNGNVGFFIGTEKLRIENKDKSISEIPCGVVDLTIQGKIHIPLAEINCVELGYAMTCHSAQGSGCPYVIVGLDMRSYALLSKEWVYTALTRAKKECILVAQINALRRAAEISRVSVKHTWLQELLIHKEEEFKRTGELPVIPCFEIKELSNTDKGDSENDDEE